MKVKTNFIANIAASLMGQAVIMYVKTFKTAVVKM